MGNFGNFLRERRKDKGITSEYVVLHTSLNENVLNALENENFDFFSSSFYFTNFLNSYLDFLEIDRERFYSEFSDEIRFINHEEKDQIIKSLTGLRYSKFSNRRLIIKGLLIGIILAIIIYLTFINKGLLFSFFEPEKITIPETAVTFAQVPEIESDFSPVSVNLGFSDDCWARISKGNEIVEEKVFMSGERFKIEGYKLKIIMGNPSVVDISVNGIKTLKYKNIASTAILKITPDTVDGI